AAGPAALAGRRLPQRDALPPPRRPRSEAARRAAGLPSGADDHAGERKALARASAARLADLVPPHRPGELDDRRGAGGGPSAGARDRQPTLAASPGPRARRHAERLRHARRKADPPRAARLARLRADPQRLAPEADPQAHRDERD